MPKNLHAAAPAPCSKNHNPGQKNFCFHPGKLARNQPEMLTVWANKRSVPLRHG